jgi:aryl-alcohol dehydrogenase-like predicted oxidoreductase
VLGLHDLRRSRARRSPWTLPEEQSRPILRQAVELGINFFDTANAYSDGTSEEIVGRALKEFTRRDEVVIATKVFFPMSKAPNGGGLSRKAIFAAIDASLQRLGTDYVDLYQIHRWDYTTPIEETLEALHDVVKAARRATSAPPPCTPGSSARRCTSPGSTAGRRSFPCRTTTTCCTARKSAK